MRRRHLKAESLPRPDRRSGLVVPDAALAHVLTGLHRLDDLLDPDPLTSAQVDGNHVRRDGRSIVTALRTDHVRGVGEHLFPLLAAFGVPARGVAHVALQHDLAGGPVLPDRELLRRDTHRDQQRPKGGRCHLVDGLLAPHRLDPPHRARFLERRPPSYRRLSLDRQVRRVEPHHEASLAVFPHQAKHLRVGEALGAVHRLLAAAAVPGAIVGADGGHLFPTLLQRAMHFLDQIARIRAQDASLGIEPHAVRCPWRMQRRVGPGTIVLRRGGGSRLWLKR